ncbi:glycosyltransferase family 2 protein [Flammeovirga kamogawensis]|uniref:Glycosyltransferase family 2 protein n=1 Tax=Flammeovirga kamogawensis TaxID=373891 RepID=A0ABX8H3M3_9BACT|nr:glycosyltransferase family A protein [Flammeovirga kamogawensis]MBB6460214.1 glycosyltransferase involved in cell wall biosynthesis [Flammeovirga kamogawensis]QWG10026.1 glycosyltransferase family 2 protein [Flammeovirga kamogawensis]TRX65534.1 glycosyltransferase family 2 protein [Flammeovirga kamogawensis]
MDISVIVPTHNRENLVIQLAESIKRQTIDSTNYEVIFICDGCVDNTVAVLNKLYSDLENWNIVAIDQSGPAKARNTGAFLAKGKYLAFTDDDCIANPNWLESILSKFNNTAVSVLGLEGMTFTDKKNVTPLTHQIENLNGNPAVPTCNAAFKKDIFLELGGFDESFPFAHNEDADFAWRMKERGEIIFVKEMGIYHPPRKEKLSKLKTRMKILESEFHLYYKNKVLYKKYRNTSPWRTIYIEVFLYHQLRMLKHVLGFFYKPKLCINGIVLVFSWWINLIELLPSFLKKENYYKKLFA